MNYFKKIYLIKYFYLLNYKNKYFLYNKLTTLTKVKIF